MEVCLRVYENFEISGWVIYDDLLYCCDKKTLKIFNKKFDIINEKELPIRSWKTHMIFYNNLLCCVIESKFYVYTKNLEFIKTFGEEYQYECEIIAIIIYNNLLYSCCTNGLISIWNNALECIKTLNTRNFG